LGQELQLIVKARRQIHENKWQAALTTLRLHAELYPAGELKPEAGTLRERALRAIAADPVE
jgi:hypothetical protein